MSSLRQRLEELEPSYRDCYDLYENTLSTVTDQHGIFNTITLTMLKNQINDQSVNTIKEAMQKRMEDLKSSEVLCPPDTQMALRNRAASSTGVTNDASLSDSLLTTEGSFDYSSDVTESLITATTRSTQSLPSKPRTLRVLIAGDINAGKTSVLNLFLGGVYLPAYPGKCTTVPCEVHNSNQRLAHVYYKEGDLHDKFTLPEQPKKSNNENNNESNNESNNKNNNESNNENNESNNENNNESNNENNNESNIENNNESVLEWEDVGKLVHFRTYSGKPVRRLVLFWPMPFFDDPHQTHVKQIAGAGSVEALPIVFLDLPGLSDNEVGVSKILENIPDFHLFIFVIDIGGVPIRKTFENMLETVKEKITMQGIDFNPESALFLLNRSDLFQAIPDAVPIEKNILSAIQPKWPMVRAEQLHRLSCTKIQSGKDDIAQFKEKIWDFLEAANRLNLDEHYLWLINLLEVINAFFASGVNWLPYEKCLREIREYAKQDNHFLDNELGMTERMKSSFCKRVMHEAKNSERKLRDYIKEHLGDSTSDLDNKLNAMMKNEEVQKMMDDFDSELKTVLEKHRKRLKENLKLVEYLEEQSKKTLDVNDILNTIATLVTIPLASIVLLGRNLAEEIEIAVSDPKDRKISRRTQCFVQQAEAAIHQETSFIISQRNIRQEIASFNATQNRNMEEPNLQHLDESLKKLWEIYIQKVLHHKFSYDEIQHVIPGGSAPVDTVRIRNKSSADFFARKCVRSKQKRNDSTQAYLPLNFNIYRELVIMRSLSRKDSENCVMFRGSASWNGRDEHVLAILMEKSDTSLDDVIKNLHRHPVSWEERLQLALGAAKGLDCLHQNGYIHRQVKPHHYLVYLGQNNGKDLVKICDFGHMKEEVVTSTTALDKRIVAYYAPELFRPAARHSTMSDVYSLGLVIWELWHCRRITCNPGEPPSIREVPSGEFKKVIKGCLDVRPERRPTSHEVVQILHCLCLVG